MGWKGGRDPAWISCQVTWTISPPPAVKQTQYQHRVWAGDSSRDTGGWSYSAFILEDLGSNPRARIPLPGRVTVGSLRCLLVPQRFACETTDPVLLRGSRAKRLLKWGPGWRNSSISVGFSGYLCHFCCWEASNRAPRAVLIPEMPRLCPQALWGRVQHQAGYPAGAPGMSKRNDLFPSSCSLNEEQRGRGTLGAWDRFSVPVLGEVVI